MSVSFDNELEISYEKMPNDELRRRLTREFNFNCGPVTPTTRSVLIKKLDRLESERNSSQVSIEHSHTSSEDVAEEENCLVNVSPTKANEISIIKTVDREPKVQPAILLTPKKSFKIKGIVKSTQNGVSEPALQSKEKNLLPSEMSSIRASNFTLKQANHAISLNSSAQIKVKAAQPHFSVSNVLEINKNIPESPFKRPLSRPSIRRVTTGFRNSDSDDSNSKNSELSGIFLNRRSGHTKKNSLFTTILQNLSNLLGYNKTSFIIFAVIALIAISFTIFFYF